MGTNILLAAGMGQAIAGLIMAIMSSFLILLVLVQRGRGGGLAGAFGGMGGQSAFGAKAGDTFTKITVVAATVWILFCMVAVRFLGNGQVDASIFGEGEATVVETDGTEDDLNIDSSEGDDGTSSLLDEAVDDATSAAEIGESTSAAEISESTGATESSESTGEAEISESDDDESPSSGDDESGTEEP